VSAARHHSDPDETDSSAVGPSTGDSGQADTETSKTTSGEATTSRRPGEACDVPAEAEKVEEEYVLEQEPDGRYRIVGRRPRKPK
jgi:hypothetical protein